MINKKQGKDIDEKINYSFIKEEKDNFEFDDNLTINEIIEDISFLANAYKQEQERLEQIDKELEAEFLSYPIPKAIIEEWERIN